MKQQNAPRNSSKSKKSHFAEARDDSLLNEIKLEFESDGGEQKIQIRNNIGADESQIRDKTSKRSEGSTSKQRSKFIGFRLENVSLGLSSNNMNQSIKSHGNQFEHSRVLL